MNILQQFLPISCSFVRFSVRFVFFLSLCVIYFAWLLLLKRTQRRPQQIYAAHTKCEYFISSERSEEDQQHKEIIDQKILTCEINKFIFFWIRALSLSGWDWGSDQTHFTRIALNRRHLSKQRGLTMMNNSSSSRKTPMQFARWTRSTNSWKVCSVSSEINVSPAQASSSKSSEEREREKSTLTHNICTCSGTTHYPPLLLLSLSSLVHQIDTFSRLKDFIHSSCSLATDTPPIYCFIHCVCCFSSLFSSLLAISFFSALIRSIIAPQLRCEIANKLFCTHKTQVGESATTLYAKRTTWEIK